MSIWLWVGFVAVILVVLVVNLFLIRRSHTPDLQEALAWTAFWVALALAFSVAVYFIYEHHWQGMGLAPGRELDGNTAALQFLTGYLIHKALSVDNIIVIALIFSFFKVPLEYQHGVLQWGIFGAVLLRVLMVAGGLALIMAFPWVNYVFGLLLIFTALRMLAQHRGVMKPARHPIIRAVKRFYAVREDFDGDRFFSHIDGVRAVTPLLLALVMVISADVIFAIDSIPAIIAVTQEPFLVFTSITFAVLGLRSLYFVLASILKRLHYVKLSLVVMLVFVGVKILLIHHFPIPTVISLAVVAAILMTGALASMAFKPPEGARLVSPFGTEIEQIVTLTVRSARRIVVLVIGSTVLLVGVIMIVTPGPALVVIPAGLAILATEFIWARRLLRRVKRHAETVSGSAMNLLRGRNKRE